MTSTLHAHRLLGIAALALLAACATAKPRHVACGHDCHHDREEESVMIPDIRAKEDIHRIGTADNGLPIYLFRYKGDRTWRIGVMAQEVLREYPDAVVTLPDGMYAVNYGRIAW